MSVMCIMSRREVDDIMKTLKEEHKESKHKDKEKEKEKQEKTPKKHKE